MLRQQEPSTTNSFGTSNSIPRCNLGMRLSLLMLYLSLCKLFDLFISNTFVFQPETSKIGKEVNLLGGWPLDIVATGCVKEVDPTYKFHERCLGERSYLVYVDEVHAQSLLYHALMMHGLSINWSELFLEILGPGIVGGLYLPMLRALPDALLILVSGLSGSKETTQSQVLVEMGLLAGSTVMLLTLLWGSCVLNWED
ncbi:hypothetical protein IFM89_003782 [Coptis chinensis]|uniref:Uncharacterized protein n=1 Tax=Coptis chinensis TaxID=261450 RepID=A0A835M1C9_9MAGN|nr:hypothetical protein IFM89_003782 [Coptis chinensis]